MLEAADFLFREEGLLEHCLVAFGRGTAPPGGGAVGALLGGIR